jgi:CBS domain-containing protein
VSSSTHLQLSALLARDAMRRRLVVCAGATGVREAAAEMTRQGVRCLLIERPLRGAGTDGPGWAVVTDEDLLAAVVDVAGPERLVRAIGRPLVVVDADDDLAAVGARLLRAGTSHALVTEHDEPVGLVTAADVLAALGGTHVAELDVRSRRAA